MSKILRCLNCKTVWDGPVPHTPKGYPMGPCHCGGEYVYEGGIMKAIVVAAVIAIPILWLAYENITSVESEYYPDKTSGTVWTGKRHE